MGTPGLSPHLALRIGLAARTLPDATLQQLMDALVDALGLPLTEKKLEHLSLGKLRAAADGLLSGVSRSALREALGYLQGHTPVTIIEDAPLPLDSYDDGDMPNSLRMAVATDHGEHIDGHFGTCAAFLIYQVSGREIRLIDRRTAPTGNRKSGRDALRATLIDDCHLVYAKTVSNPASARLMAARIHPVSFPEGGLVREKLSELQQVLLGHPAPWLARTIGHPMALPPRRGMSGPVLVHSAPLSMNGWMKAG
jgi:nitrogen fixation protein NifX